MPSKNKFVHFNIISLFPPFSVSKIKFNCYEIFILDTESYAKLLGTYILLLLGIFYWKEKEVRMSRTAFHRYRMSLLCFRCIFHLANQKYKYMEWKYDKMIPDPYIRDRDKSEIQQFFEKDKKLKMRRLKEERKRKKKERNALEKEQYIDELLK